jgi:PhnB protein
MLKKAKSVPRGYRTVTPYLIIKDAASAIDYYKQAFKAKVLMCLSETSGKVGHAEIKIGDSRMMLADEYPEMGSRGPQSFGGSPVSILLYVDDCDEILKTSRPKKYCNVPLPDPAKACNLQPNTNANLIC